jgi:hypothetical protein
MNVLRDGLCDKAMATRGFRARGGFGIQIAGRLGDKNAGRLAERDKNGAPKP